MNFQFDAIMLLALFTLGAGLAIGIVSFTRAKRAQNHHEDAAVAERQRHEDAGAVPEGTPGDIDPTVTGSTQSSPDIDQGLDPDRAAPDDAGRTWDKDRGANPPMPMPPRN